VRCRIRRDLLCHSALPRIRRERPANCRLEDRVPRVQQNRLRLATRREEDRAVDRERKEAHHDQGLEHGWLDRVSAFRSREMKERLRHRAAQQRIVGVPLAARIERFQEVYVASGE
jgi:hypothetical protein